MAIVISGVNNNDKITASDGTIDLLSGVNYAGIITAPAFTTPGNITAGHFNIGSGIQLGNAGVATATTFVGNLTGNVNNTGNLLLQISGSEKFRVGGSGQLGIGGANYGTSGQVLTSGGSGSAATWSTINSDAINEGNTKAEVVDTGSDGHFKVETEGSERLRIDSNGKITQTAKTDTTAILDLYGGNTTVSATGEVNGQIRFRSKDSSVTNSEENVGSALKSITEFSNGAYVGMSIETYQQDRSPRLKEAFRISYAGQIGLMGPNYGTAGQVLTSQGPSSPVQWAAAPTPYGGALDGMIFGGTETTYTSGGTTYKVHTFTSSGFLRVTAAISMNFLIVGGGGGSSNAELSYGATGGGGAGGMVEGTGITIPAGKHAITVGLGGAAGGTYALAGNGGDSIFNYGTTITAKGGGGGSDYGTDGQDGGSGSGGAEPNRAAGSSTQSSQNSGVSGIAQFGNAGGVAAGYQNGAGGGGGAGGAGQARSAGGAGGSGRANTITGSSVTYAVGGNGGATGYVNASAGTNGRGNGATGATSSHPNEGAGAAGGSGIVIVRYVFS